MLKKIAWIAALLAAFAMVFAGCTNMGIDIGDPADKAAANPIVDGAKYLEISKRVNGWDSIDLRTGKAKNLDNFTEGAEHTITIYGGNAVAGKNVYLGNTDDNYSVNWGYIAVKADGTFTITAKVPWNWISNPQNNKRISIDAPSAGGPTSVFIYEVVINDGSKDIYKLSEDKEIQDMANGSQPIQSDTVGTTWWIKAGTPVVTVIEAGASEPIEVTFDHDNAGKIDKKKVIPGAKLGSLPKISEKTDNVFIGWFDSANVEWTSASMIPEITALALKAKWGAKGTKTVNGETLVHSYPSLTNVNPTAAGRTINADGSVTYAAQTSDYTGGRSQYEFPTEVTSAKPYTYNVVELTIEIVDFETTGEGEDTIDTFGVTLKRTNDWTFSTGATADVFRYPSGSQYVEGLKKGDTVTFSVAIADLLAAPNGGNTIAFERKTKGGAATIRIIKAVFSKGTLYTVSFDGTAQVKATDVPSQSVLAAKKAIAPAAAPGWILNQGLNVYDFLGWYLNGEKFDFDTMFIDKDIDLVSKWSVIYKRTVSFNLNGATFEIDDGDGNMIAWTGSPQEFATLLDANPDGDNIVYPTLKTKPTNSGTFAGWFDVSVNPPKMYYDATATVPAAVTGIELTRDVTLTASYLIDITLPLTLATDVSGYYEDGFGGPAEGTLASGKLTVDFSTGEPTTAQPNRQIVFFQLTDAQIASLMNASIITITVTLSDPVVGTVRCGFANITTGSSWDASSLGNLSTTDEVTEIKSGWTGSGGKSNGWKWLIIQTNDATAKDQTIVIESIVISAL